MHLENLECPNCGAKDLVQDSAGQLICDYCSSSFGEVMRICPDCGEYNEEGARHCARCGQPLVRDCPACGAVNWILADHCIDCGRSLNIIEQMARRWQQTTRERLVAWQAGVGRLKEQEEVASQQRMAVLMEAERIRQEALALAEASRRQRDRQMYVLLVAGLALFVFIVVLFLVLGALRP